MVGRLHLPSRPNVVWMVGRQRGLLALSGKCSLLTSGIFDGVLTFVTQMIANFFYGVGSMLIFAMSTTMLTEFMPRRSSSGVALNNFCRNILSCIGAFVGAPLIGAIGNGWLFTILGIWTLSGAMVIWAMKKYASQWREKMDKEDN